MRILAILSCFLATNAMAQGIAGNGGDGIAGNSGNGASGSASITSGTISGVNITSSTIGPTVIAKTAHDEKIGTDGVISAASTAFSSASATFSPSDIGKSIILDGLDVGGADLSAKIASYVDAHDVIISAATTYAAPWYSIGRALHASTTDITSSYVIGDVLTVSGGTTVAGASGAFTIISLEVSSPTVNAGGSGGANGACTVMGTTGTTRTQWQHTTSSNPLPSNGYFTATGTVSGGALSGALTVVQPGDYSTAPSSQTAEPVIPVSGCAGLTGATVTLKMGPHALQQTTAGHYTTLPTNPVATTGGTGSGATLSLFGLGPNGNSTSVYGDKIGGYWAYGTDDTASINNAIAATQAAGGGTVALPTGRSLMLGAFSIPYVGTSPPVQPWLQITGGGQLPPQTSGGRYISAYGSTSNGSTVDNRYAGGDSSGHVAKIDTRGMGTIRLNNMSLVDWGTDNYIMFQTTNTQPFIDHMTFLGNPTCFQQSCLQNAIRIGGITSAATTLSTNGATDGYQANSPSVTNNLFGFINEAIQFGGSANTGYIENNQVDSTSGSWTTAPYHFYGAAFGTEQNTFLGGEAEMWGYPYVVYMDNVGSSNVANTFLNLAGFDGSGLTAGQNGAPTISEFYLDANSGFTMIIGAPEDDIRYNFVNSTATTNTIINSYANPFSSFQNGLLVSGKLGVNTTNPINNLEYGNGTGNQTFRIFGGASGSSTNGGCVVIGNGSDGNKTYFGNKSACIGGTFSENAVVNNNAGETDLTIFNATQFAVTNGLSNAATQFAIGGAGSPTISSGACGSGSNGTVSGTNQTGIITISSSPTTSCAVSFSASLSQAPKSCSITAATSASAATSVLPYISSLSSSGFTLSGTALASTSFYFQCI